MTNPSDVSARLRGLFIDHEEYALPNLRALIREAADLIDAQSKLLAEREWRVIDDGTPPEKLTEVLVYIPKPVSEKYRCVSGYYGITADGSHMWVVGGQFAFDVGDPTHWQPLPSPPKLSEPTK